MSHKFITAVEAGAGGAKGADGVSGDGWPGLAFSVALKGVIVPGVAATGGGVEVGGGVGGGG